MLSTVRRLQRVLLRCRTNVLANACLVFTFSHHINILVRQCVLSGSYGRGSTIAITDFGAGGCIYCSSLFSCVECLLAHYLRIRKNCTKT